MAQLLRKNCTQNKPRMRQPRTTRTMKVMTNPMGRQMALKEPQRRRRRESPARRRSLVQVEMIQQAQRNSQNHLEYH